MPITKRPCANCPFRHDAAAIELRPGRLKAIIQDLLHDDTQTFVCHKTLDGSNQQRMTCAGAVAVMGKLGRLPVIARLGLRLGVITKADIEASQQLVIDPQDHLKPACNARPSENTRAHKAPSRDTSSTQAEEGLKNA